MTRTSVVVVGAGQAGLAVSHLLTGAGIDHVVLERGRTAQRWDSHRWESLRLLTPNWLSRLPGHRYTGPDPAGFMTAREVAGYLRGYAAGAPVVEGAEVVSVRPGFTVDTTAGTWTARAVVLATGWADLPRAPTVDLPLPHVSPAGYRNPDALPDGGVLVVGAGASGVQLADELNRAGRHVVLAVGAHARLPRRYRGLDIMWWLDAMGVLDRGRDKRRNPHEPSLQLAGRADGRDVDLRTLHERGVVLAGRLTGAAGAQAGAVARFADDLAATTAHADARLHGLLRRIDAFAAATGLTGEIDPAAPVRPVPTTGAPTEVDLRRAGIGSVIWATGYRRAYPWLHVPVLDRAGEIRHRFGATPAAGLHVVGMRWQSRRNSSNLDGVRHDAASVVAGVLDHLGAACGRAA